MARFRRAHYVQGWSLKRIVRELHVSGNTARKILQSDETDFTCERDHQPMPRIGPWQQNLEAFLQVNADKALRERLHDLTTGDFVANRRNVVLIGVFRRAKLIPLAG